ncbi:MAG: 3-oxoacyl-[acyl-carrier-protein] reductase [Candidatus Lambdaproteobacteria bacterium RIFOXYD1_FULL_56_27]|uniref:3-oxoacyl-[acyl-carrier-protein] reductase n=1 Tax=Candidatus Lambdaproteobacteria bacterium RIFOXYD2_FULL_56_26 TaxID=1817773 RepID=A0A1F6H3J6_9PROT|nr:MAG: 3-oxoacyl-[acyl-carrier-protein] reductase [Candidatus Lambdaproteobacteria bacterium RIFOXYC1_FULL_56_13]OGH04942.1 MAG: 3-oxoacyl-[acyl-carrier-protein] reductase [Candidatus Lambdaproteobacteria bacterium RIFOXYD2_FULL_56_26]OGH09407.1 MAG: 3-oxoacyl-[acyl-carrier-protein] reductase [Candidatus Lambdaproteobacteria bacterium RIFOXYD1_FULL_56_27]
MIDLSSKTALVTGGTRGIGRGIVEALAQAGAKVVFSGRTEATAQAAVEELAARGITAYGIGADVASFAESAALVEKALAHLGKIDILVNNAGITKDQLFLKMSEEDWGQVINTNLTGIFNVTKAVIKPMLKAKYGRIINIGSVVGSTGNPGQVNYASTKAAVIGFTKSLAKEVAARNITCNAIAPGFIATDMTEELSEAQKQTLLEQIPLKRLGTAADIAGGVLFLASPLADYVNGTVLHINGGMY